jgi:ligand-binding sensor domain-containing protein
VWEYAAGAWTQSLQPDEPYEHNGQALQLFKGELFLSTLEDGLAVRTENGWQQLGDTTLSSNAPRQMVEFQGALYVRHGGGKIDRFDGTSWKRDVFSWLPRRKAMAIATDGQRLYVAQWGGWSEWDGQTWTHFLRLPELQGLPLMSLQPDGETLWIGTQSRGIIEATRTIEAVTAPKPDTTSIKTAQTITPALPQVTYKITWHDERHALPDDWVTCLAKLDDTIYAGTFIGGLAYRAVEKWQHLKELEGENVTAIEPDGNGGLFIATRNGVWQKPSSGALRRLNDTLPFLDTEAQALCRAPQGLWIATRTGLYFVTEESLRPRGAMVARTGRQ